MVLEPLESRQLLAVDFSLVKDLNTAIGDTQISEFEQVGSTTFFVAKTPGSNGLWKTDGTATGTTFLKTFGTGVGQTDMPLELTNVAGTLYFTAGNQFGRELWKSDGTSSGTVMIKDIAAGTGAYPTGLVNLAGTLFFAAERPGEGRELWKSNGTVAGTTLVSDIVPGAAGSTPEDLTVVGPTLYFTATTPSTGRELFKSAGTASTTSLVKDIEPGVKTSFIKSMTGVSGKLYFTACTAYDCNLWKSLGTSSTTFPIVNEWETHPSQLTPVNGKLYFTAKDRFHFDTQIWSVDPAVTTGLSMFSDFLSYEAGMFPDDRSNPANLTNCAGTLYFTAYDSFHTYLFKAVPGAQPVKVNPRNPSSEAQPFVNVERLTNVNGVLYFWAEDDHGLELWTSDASGARRAHDLKPGPASSVVPAITGVVNGKLLFVEPDNSGSIRLYAATRSSLTLISSVGNETGNAFVPGPSSIGANVAGTLYFSPETPSGVNELWKSDGTTANTTKIFSFTNGYIAHSIADLHSVNGQLLFSIRTSTGAELWKSNGTPLGTQLIKRFSSIANTLMVGSTLYFVGAAGNGGELWKTDGTIAGTVEVKDIVPGSRGSRIVSISNVGSTLYFGITDASNELQLWKSDGTAVGTTKIKSIGITDLSVYDIVSAGSRIFFTVRSVNTYGFVHAELWVSGGTANSTLRLLTDDNLRTTLGWLTPLGNKVLFAFSDSGSRGTELWSSDGTIAGTKLLKEIRAGSASSSPSQFVNLNGTIYFAANNGINGSELWKSNGTAAGTVMVKDIFPGSRSSQPDYLVNLNGTLYFTANDGISGMELWKSNGTQIGTVLEADINPGPSSSRPANLMRFRGRLLMTAVGRTTGRELWIENPSLTFTNAPAEGEAVASMGTQRVETQRVETQRVGGALAQPAPPIDYLLDQAADIEFYRRGRKSLTELSRSQLRAVV